MNRVTPVALFLVIIIASGASFVYFVQTPGSGQSQGSGTYNSTQLIVLYANAEGWNYNSSNPNPTLHESTHVLLEFKVIEQDNLPHTLTINPGPNESSSNAIFSVNIPPVTGTIVWANWTFNDPGVFTYWCEVHPETMVGLLLINASQNNTSNSSSAQIPGYVEQELGYVASLSSVTLIMRGIHEEF